MKHFTHVALPAQNGHSSMWAHHADFRPCDFKEDLTETPIFSETQKTGVTQRRQNPHQGKESYTTTLGFSQVKSNN